MQRREIVKKPVDRAEYSQKISQNIFKSHQPDISPSNCFDSSPLNLSQTAGLVLPQSSSRIPGKLSSAEMYAHRNLTENSFLPKPTNVGTNLNSGKNFLASTPLSTYNQAVLQCLPQEIQQQYRKEFYKKYASQAMPHQDDNQLGLAPRKTSSALQHTPFATGTVYCEEEQVPHSNRQLSMQKQVEHAESNISHKRYVSGSYASSSSLSQHRSEVTNQSNSSTCKSPREIRSFSINDLRCDPEQNIFQQPTYYHKLSSSYDVLPNIDEYFSPSSANQRNGGIRCFYENSQNISETSVNNRDESIRHITLYSNSSKCGDSSKVPNTLEIDAVSKANASTPSLERHQNKKSQPSSPNTAPSSISPSSSSSITSKPNSPVNNSNESQQQRHQLRQRKEIRFVEVDEETEESEESIDFSDAEESPPEPHTSAILQRNLGQSTFEHRTQRLQSISHFPVNRTSSSIKDFRRYSMPNQHFMGRKLYYLVLMTRKMKDLMYFDTRSKL